MATQERDKTHRIAPRSLDRARELRRGQTPPGATLWSRLRGSQLCGYRFRRQHPIGPFVADFYFAGGRLVIELDGDSHADQPSRDVARTEWLLANGYQVLRITNRDLGSNMEGVLETVVANCQRLAGLES